ncbi:MAG TPA: hypothetical protein VGH19_07805 [Verrucomicrobiae bacterium]
MPPAPEHPNRTASQILRYGGVEEAVAKFEAGSDPHEIDEMFCTPIIYAAARGSWLAFETLIKHGADPAHTGRFGETAFGIALAGTLRANSRNWSQRQIADCKKIVKHLALHGSLSPEQEAVYAIAKNKWKRVAELLANGLSIDAGIPDCNADITPPTTQKQLDAYTEKCLSKKNPTIVVNQLSLLMWAAGLGRFEIYDSLLKAGADENYRDAFDNPAKDYFTHHSRNKK